MDIATQAIPLGELHESPWNPRKHFPQQSLEELAESIRKVGVLAPVLVRPRGAGGYEIAAGHRRTRSAKLAKLAEIPAIVRPMGDQEFLEILTIENLQREDVHPLEEGEGYRTLMRQTKWDVPTVAAKIGKSVSYVYQRLKLAELIEPVKKAFLEDTITAGHAILIAKLQPKDQAEALKHCFDWHKEPVSVRDLAHWIDTNVHLELSKAPWKKDDETLCRNTPACKACHKRSGYAPELFPDVGKRDVCLDRDCYHTKQAAYLERTVTVAASAGSPLLKLDEHGWGARQIGVLKHDQQYADAKVGSCSHVQKGIIVAGDHIGQVKTVCASPSCKEHLGRYSSYSVGGYARQQREAARKKVLKTALTTEILRQAREKVDVLKRADLETLALAFFVDIWNELQKAVVRMEGWETAGKKLKHSHLTEATIRVQKMSDRDLTRFLFTLSHARALADFGYGYGEKVKPETRLREAAQRLGVNVAAIEKAQKTEEAARLRTKAEREARAKQKAKAKPKGNGKAEASATTYPEPTCTVCGCTEGMACDGGCSWVKLDKKTNAGLCSACAPPAKKATKKPVQTSAAAAA